MTNQLQRIINLSKQTGDRVVVVHENENESPFVILSFNEYEKIINGASNVRDLNEHELLDKINRDIAIWRSSQDKGYADNLNYYSKADLYPTPGPAPTKAHQLWEDEFDDKFDMGHDDDFKDDFKDDWDWDDDQKSDIDELGDQGLPRSQSGDSEFTIPDEFPDEFDDHQETKAPTATEATYVPSPPDRTDFKASPADDLPVIEEFQEEPVF